MSSVVDLHGQLDDTLIESLAMFSAGELTTAELKSRHKLDAEEWARLASPSNSPKLRKLVEARKIHRAQMAALTDNHELITDLCRFRESLLSEKFIRRKYRLDNATWERLGSDEGNALVEKVEEESLRRVRDGSAKKERAQALVVKGPAILDSIASDSSASPRHRVDALKTLDTMAANGPQNGPAADPSRFVIQINLGSDTLTFNKSIRPLEPGEIDPDDVGTDTPKSDRPIAADAGDTGHDADINMFAAFAAAKRSKGSGGGQQGHI